MRRRKIAPSASAPNATIGPIDVRLTLEPRARRSVAGRGRQRAPRGCARARARYSSACKCSELGAFFHLLGASSFRRRDRGRRCVQAARRPQRTARRRPPSRAYPCGSATRRGRGCARAPVWALACPLGRLGYGVGWVTRRYALCLFALFGGSEGSGRSARETGDGLGAGRSTGDAELRGLLDDRTALVLNYLSGLLVW